MAFPKLRIGGYYPGPDNCVSRHSTAIIIPVRDREEHLRYEAIMILNIIIYLLLFSKSSHGNQAEVHYALACKFFKASLNQLCFFLLAYSVLIPDMHA